MKILHHGYAYPNYCKCSSCGCEFIYEDTETVSVLDRVYCKLKPLVWTYILCPECNAHNSLYNYKGEINKVRVYPTDIRNITSDDYNTIDFDKNTMERR